MSRKKQIICIAIFVISVSLVISVFFSGCDHLNSMQPGEYPIYTSIRDIPGITDNEIAEIEKLRERRSSFVYGTMHSTETFIDTNGEIKGFTALLCGWLSELIGIPFEIRFYEWSDMLAGLESGEIDFTGELTATEERRETYLMTEAIAGRSVKYMRITGEMPLTSVSETRLPRYAFLRDTTTFNDVSANLGDTVEYFFADTYEEAHRMLKDRVIDAFIDEGTAEAAFDIYGDVTAEDFYPLMYGPVSLATQKPANQAIISAIDKTLEHGALYYLYELYNLGSGEYMRHKLMFNLTDEEKEYISDNPVVKFVAEYDNYPVSFYNAAEGKWQGVCFDVLEEVEALTGLKFKRVSEVEMAWSDIMTILESGEASIITELVHTPDREGRFIWPGTPLITDQYALVSKSEHKKISINEVWLTKVGVISDTAHQEMFSKWFPKHLYTTEYSDFTRAFSALQEGEVDMVLASRNQLMLLTHYQEVAGYKTNFIFNYPLVSTLGFNKDDVVLCSIIDRALRMIDIKGIADDWAGRTYDYRQQIADSNRPLLSGLVILLVCLVLVLLMLITIIKENFKTERLAMEATIREKGLVAANESLDRINRMKNEFFQNMSHDFKTPLTVISAQVLNVTDMLDFNLDKEDIRDSMDTAQREVMRLTRMVDGSMKQSYLYDNRQDMEPLDLGTLLREQGETFRALLERNGNNLTINIPQKPLSIFGNNDMLLHVLSNLLSNANRHTRNGEISITVKESDETITVVVKDSGSGVRPELLPYIFERGVSDTGTGLGLSICEAAIQAHGGKISISSEYGQGTVVVFTLPTYNDPAGEVQGNG